MWLLALVLVGCGPECATATCRADRAVAEWPADPAGVTARVVAGADDIERSVIVGRLCEAFPGQTRALCDALPEGTSRSRCERLNNRPHLAVGAASAGPPAPMSGGAPIGVGSPPVPNLLTSSDLPLVPLPLVAAKAPPVTCAGEADPAACLDDGAAEAAIAGDYGRADETCAQHAEARYADECRFHAAEEAVRRGRNDAYPGAAALCTASSAFAQECLAHVLTRVPRRVPPPYADATGAKDAISSANRIRKTWAAAGEAAAAAHVGRFWALYFANAYRQTEAPDGTPLLYYPKEAWPHVRAAVAMRLGELHRLTGPLATQVARLRDGMGHQEGRGARRGQPPDLVYVADLGSPAADGPVVWFLGGIRRPLGEDAETDAIFCVLEAAGRAQPPDRAVLEEAAHHANPRVAAEAARLLAAVSVPTP